MKINAKVLNIPPFISTAWKNVYSIQMDLFDTNPIVVVFLTNGVRIDLPPLDTTIVESIFTSHAQYLEELPLKNNPNNRAQALLSKLPLPLIQMGGLEPVSNPLQHNPEQTDLPDMPQEIIDKMIILCKAMGFENDNTFVNAEENCKCLHCQISRAIRKEKEDTVNENISEEEVSAEDLRFRLWDIQQTTETLYLVSNPLDSQEHYHVCLGDTVGCSCGQKNCEHIRAVLNS